MALILHPRAAPDRGLQIWLGATGLTGPPDLSWFLDGRPVMPEAKRVLGSARTTDMVSAGTPRVFTGVFAFTDGVTPGSTYEVSVRSATGEHTALRVHCLPEELPPPGGSFPDGLDTFNVLLASCFHYKEDKQGAAGALVAGLPARLRPHLTLFAGDQVYLDLPTLKNFKGDLAWLAATFEKSYVHNWFEPLALARILKAAPSAAIPDDHEYWNNAPHGSPIVQDSWNAQSRKNWFDAAQQLYKVFQLSEPGRFESMLWFDVRPLSFFLMDNRTFRQADRSRTLPPNGIQQFRDWVAHVKEDGLYGVIVTGQSLFQSPACWGKALLGDRHLANYDDYTDIMDGVLDLARDGRSVLCLTGDVHYGRVISAVDDRTGARLHEVISSPASLVTTVGMDQVSALNNAVGSLFGRRDPSHRHRDAAKAPAVFKPGSMGSPSLRLETRFPLNGERGNHVTLLRFRQAGFGVEVTIHHLMTEADKPVSGNGGVTIDLTPTQ